MTDFKSVLKFGMNITLENARIEQAIKERNNLLTVIKNTDSPTWGSCKSIAFYPALRKEIDVERAIRITFLGKQWNRNSDESTPQRRKELNQSRKLFPKEEFIRLLLPKAVDRCPVFDTVLDYGLKENVITDDHRFRPSLDRIDNNKDEHPDNLWIISRKANIMRGNLSIEEFKDFMKRSKL